jgi:hypothetical protein
MRDRRGLLLPTAGPLYGDPIYPGNGYPRRPGEDRAGLSAFGRLAMGQTLGKSSILIYDHELEQAQQAPVDMLTIEGDDLDASQLVLTLHPPRVIPLPFYVIQERLDQQNLTGEQTNGEVTAGHFPGTHHPIRWPPLEAKIQFGTGGVSTEAVVDYINGVTLSVTASFLRANALVTQSKRDGDIFGTSAAYYLAAHVGPGFVKSLAQRTIYVGEVGNLEQSDIFDVPKFAKRACVVGRSRDTRHHHRRQPRLFTGWISFWQSPDGTGGVGEFFVSGNQPMASDIPNGGQYFSVYNESGHRMKLSAPFELVF